MSRMQDETRRLRTSPEALQQCLDRLDQDPASGELRSLRRSDRYPYRVGTLAVELSQSGSAWVRYEVPSRNLSREGASFLLGHFVYLGTRCRIHLVDRQHQARAVAARVVRCRYLEGSGTLHEVGVKFERPIDVALFACDAARPRFMVVDDDPGTATLVEQWLGRERVEVTRVREGPQALQAAASGRYELILLEVGASEPSGIETARELRRQGFACPIVMTSAADDDTWRGECLAAGADEFLPKPLSLEGLLHAIKALYGSPHFSSVVEDGSSDERVRTFVSELPGKVAQLWRAFGNSDYADLATQVQTLKDEGQTCGFQPITDGAAELERAIGGLQEPNDVGFRLSALTRQCLSARMTPPNQCSLSAD